MHNQKSRQHIVNSNETSLLSFTILIAFFSFDRMSEAKDSMQ